MSAVLRLVAVVITLIPLTCARTSVTSALYATVSQPHAGASSSTQTSLLVSITTTHYWVTYRNHMNHQDCSLHDPPIQGYCFMRLTKENKNLSILLH